MKTLATRKCCWHQQRRWREEEKETDRQTEADGGGGGAIEGDREREGQRGGKEREADKRGWGGEWYGKTEKGEGEKRRRDTERGGGADRSTQREEVETDRH